MKWKEMLVTLGCGMAVIAGTLVASAAAVAPVQETPKPAAEAQEGTAHPGPRRIRVSGNVQAAKLGQRVDPEYPKEAKKKHLEGNVRIRILVDNDGSVIKADALSGHHILAKAAIAAVRQWRYQTTLLNGDPVQVESEVEVHFHRHKWRVD